MMPPARSDTATVEHDAGRRTPAPLEANASAPFAPASTRRFSFGAWMDGADALDALSDGAMLPGPEASPSGASRPPNQQSSQNQNNSSRPFDLKLSETPDSRALARGGGGASEQPDGDDNSLLHSPVRHRNGRNLQNNNSIPSSSSSGGAAAGARQRLAESSRVPGTGSSDGGGGGSQTDGSNVSKDYRAVSDDLLARYRRLRINSQQPASTAVNESPVALRTSDQHPVTPSAAPDYADSLDTARAVKTRTPTKSQGTITRFTLDFDLDSMDSPPSASTSRSNTTSARTDFTADSLTPRSRTAAVHASVSGRCSRRPRQHPITDLTSH